MRWKNYKWQYFKSLETKAHWGEKLPRKTISPKEKTIQCESITFYTTATVQKQRVKKSEGKISGRIWQKEV